jgi:hypothetical protein
MVVACTALFVALGGVSYGVAVGAIDTNALRNNTVRTQDLRNNDIRGIDIRNSTIRTRDVALNTLTNADIAESKLGQVPSAARAEDARTLGGIGVSGFLRQNTGPFVGVALAEAWETIAGETTPGYFVDPMGFVHLHGAMRRTSGTSEFAFTLPAGARPRTVKRLPVYAENAGNTPEAAGVSVEPSGAVHVRASTDAAGGLISLEGATFRAGD